MNIENLNSQSASNIRPAQIVPSNLTISTMSNIKINSPYNLSKFRFIQLAFYILSDLANSITIFSFQTIAAQISRIYDLDSFLVSLNISVYSLMYPFISFIANYLIDTRGASYSVKIGLLLTLIGAIIRIFVNYGWSLVIISSIFCGAGGPLIFNAKCRFQSNWFGAYDLSQITTISTILTTCNSVFGSLFPGIYFSDYDYKNDTSKNYEKGKSLLENMLIIECIIIAVLTIINIIFLKEKPAIPPSYISTLQREKFSTAVKVMIKNKPYLKVIFSSMIYVGTVNGLQALFAFVIEPWGFNQNHYVMCAAGMILGGILGASINAYLLKKYKMFKLTIVILLLWMATITLILAFIINTYEIWGLIILVSLFGFGYYPLASTTYELACEIAFPVGEGSAQGFLMGVNSIFGFVCVTLFSLFVKGESKFSTYLLLGIIITSLCVCSLLIHKSKILLNRLETEKTQLFNLNKKTDNDGLKKESSICLQQKNNEAENKQKESV